MLLALGGLTLLCVVAVAAVAIVRNKRNKEEVAIALAEEEARREPDVSAENLTLTPNQLK